MAGLGFDGGTLCEAVKALCALRRIKNNAF
jgi:hypothetical protein